MLLTACGLADDDLLRDQLSIALRTAIPNPYTDKPTKHLICVGVAFYVATLGQVERAVRLIAVAVTYPKLSERWWLDEWAWLQNLCVELDAELGSEPYHAVWPHGPRHC